MLVVVQVCGEFDMGGSGTQTGLVMDGLVTGERVDWERVYEIGLTVCGRIRVVQRSPASKLYSGASRPCGLARS